MGQFKGEMAMKEDRAVSKRRLGAMELLGICGFAFFFGWMLVAFYWLFVIFLQDIPIALRDGIQLFIFIGMASGYMVLHLVAKRLEINRIAVPMLAAEAMLTLLLPLCALALSFGIALPVPLLCGVNLLTGLCGASLTVGWLDVSSRIRLLSLERFTSLSLVGGGILFLFVALMPTNMQPFFCIMYALASIGLQAFAGARARDDTDTSTIRHQKSPWKFTKEIEPSLVAFGIVFGLTFVYLFNSGTDAVLVGLLFVIPGAGIVAAFALQGKAIGIIAIQRILLCVTVLACLAIPFSTESVQLACSCLVVASWAAFISINYALVVKKSIRQEDTSVFRQIPLRLVFSALGFFLGWGVATAITAYYGAHSDAFTVVRLSMAFILVAVIMLFFPVDRHHDDVAHNNNTAPSPLSLESSTKEPFDSRCAAVAELYQLSPRETDILKFLAKGRNAAYIQSKLTISPHTVKSHIYNIYRKLNIHSQQKLMDFVEDCPIDGPKPG